MSLEGHGKLLRIFIGESDQWHHRPLYEVRVARKMGLAGVWDAPPLRAAMQPCGMRSPE
jgi:PII-like signaling protein